MAAKAVHEFFTVYALDQLSFIVVTQGPAELVEVHVPVVLLITPPNRYGVGFCDAKLQPRVVIRVLNDIGVSLLQKGIQKLPQLHTSFTCIG